MQEISFSLSDYDLLTVEEVARIHDYTTAAVCQWIRKGLLRAIHVGSTGRPFYLIPKREVNNFNVPLRGAPSHKKKGGRS